MMENHQQESIGKESKEEIAQDASIEEQVTDSGVSSRTQTGTFVSDETSEFLRNALEKNRSNSTFCSQVLSTQHLFREEMYVNDPNRPIEPDAVELKLGKITLRRAFSTTSMQLLIEKEQRTIPTAPFPQHIRASRSWSDFGFWINMANGQFRRRVSPIDEELFKISCQIFEMASASPSIDFEERYDLAKLLLPKYYPNYWNYLSEVYSPLESDSDLCLKDVVNKFNLVKSCKNILKEEERYSLFTADDIGKRRRIPIKNKLDHLNGDFRVAGVFLKEEYPDVFTYLIQKSNYVNILVDTFSVEKNKLLIIEASIQPVELLIELEEEYSNQDDENSIP